LILVLLRQVPAIPLDANADARFDATQTGRILLLDEIDLNTDSITSLCDFIKEQNPPRLRRIEACVRVRVK
jgi:hypothetical protein